MNVRRRPFGLPDVLVPTGSESAAFDRHAIDGLGVPQPVLMENAGRAAASLVHRMHPGGEVVAVVGAGNNGGDALVALRTLAAWGRPVRAVLVADREPGELLHGWRVPVVRDGDLDDDGWAALLAGASVVVDGILGTGISGAPRERQARAIRRVNQAGRPVVALDVPSGADADTGATPGAVIDADATVCFGHPKLGCLFHPARARVGRLLAVEIGFPPHDPERVPFTGRLVTPGWANARRPTREPDTHKNAVGAVLVVAGRPGMAGAAVLAARAALRAGAGLVRVSSPEANRTVLQSSAPEAVFVDVDDPDALGAAVEASRAVVVGPGLGTHPSAATRVRTVLAGLGDRALLVDADGLNLLAAGEVDFADVVAGRPVIVTPHPGEMARLLGIGTADVTGDRVGAARRLADERRCAVLLKGAPSIVASPNAPLLVDSVGSSALATGGMGDVLSGVVGAFLARGVEPREAGALGLFTSGRAARLAGGGAGLLPTDVVHHLPGALAEEGDGETDLAVPGLLFDQDPAR